MQRQNTSAAIQPDVSLVWNFIISFRDGRSLFQSFTFCNKLDFSSFIEVFWSGRALGCFLQRATSLHVSAELSEASPCCAVMQSSCQRVYGELLFLRPQQESSRCLWEAFTIPASWFHSPVGCHFSNICFAADSLSPVPCLFATLTVLASEWKTCQIWYEQVLLFPRCENAPLHLFSETNNFFNHQDENILSAVQ